MILPANIRSCVILVSTTTSHAAIPTDARSLWGYFAEQSPIVADSVVHVQRHATPQITQNHT